MPTRRIFDMVIITVLLVHPAVGLAKMAIARHCREDTGVSRTVAEAGRILL